MDKEPFLELIEEKKDNDSDIDIEKQIYEQQTKVRNPNIPESLKTPETSQKKMIKIKNSSKLILDNDHDSEIYESIISLNDPKIKIRTKHSTTYNYFNKGKNSTKSIINKIIPHKPYSYRRPFSKKKRKFIYILICLINIFINLDRGAIPAGTTEIKNKNKISNAELGMIGSLLYLGLILGSISGGYFFSKYASKWLVISSLFILAFFLYSFTLLESSKGMYLCRIICGFCEVFCFIYFPIWVDQYGVKGSKVIWITFLQLGVPVGTILGYLIEALSIKYYNSWEGGFFFQILFICVLSGILFLTPDKFFERNYKHSESTQEEIENEFKIFKKSLSKKLEKNKSRYLLQNMNLINDLYNNKYGRPSLYSIFSMIDTEEDINTHKYFEVLSKLIKNKNYILTMFGISCSLFVITGMQFWISDYMQEVIHLESSKTYIIYAIVSISAPTLGVLTGGFLIQYLGGYTEEKALNACCKLTFIGFICSIFLPLFNTPIIFVIFMWLMLFFESSITPGLTGLMISTIPDNYKEIGNSLTQLFYNLIGFLPSPYIYGLVTSFTGGEDSKWGLAVIILWSFFGFLSLFFGQKYFINNNKNEICKEIYLDNIINNDNDDLINISNISNLHSKRKSSYDSNFSEEFNEDDNIEYNNTKNENEDNIEYIRGKRTSIIQNIYGGMNHIKT
jgi:MFS family permease